MITGDSYNQMTFEQYRQRVILPKLAKLHLPVITQVDKDAPVLAYVNAGRWIVRCECGGAEFAWENKLFMCQSCFNAAHKGKYREVIFPADRATIEAVLKRRPLPNRNWLVTETADDLEKENIEHKAELLAEVE